MRFTSVFYILTFLFCSHAHSKEFVSGDIKRIYPNNNKVHFRLKNDTCISESQYYFFYMNSSDSSVDVDAKNWYSMLLASAIASKPITVRVEACPEEGNVEANYIFQDY